MALLSVKQLAGELGISAKTVYRAYRNREIPAGQVRRAMEQRAQAMPYQKCAKGSRAPGGASRRRAKTRRPRTVRRGRS